MTSPIGRSNSNIRGFGKGVTTERERTRNANNNPNRTDVVKTTTRDNGSKVTQTTQRTTTRTDAKGREHVDAKKAKTKEPEKKKIEREWKEDAYLQSDTKTFFDTKKPTDKALAEGTGKLWGADLKGSVEGPRFSMTGDASLTRKDLGFDIDVKAKIDANLISASGSAEKEFKFNVNGEEVVVKLKLGAEGNVGINGELDLKVHVGKDGISISAGADGFIGARGSLAGSIDIEVNGKRAVGGELKLTVAAGAMAGADFELSKDHFKAKTYLAAGVGAGLEITGNYSLKNIATGGAALALPGHQGW
ncbi:MAG: hypothetical protein IT380_01325 [Myxococcales bacterium]|nr:hypothetical protein [Myxococcales bacterium]